MGKQKQMKFSPYTVANATMSCYTFPCLVVGYNAFADFYECNPINPDLTFQSLLIIEESELSPINKGSLEPKFQVGTDVYCKGEGKAKIIQQVSGIDNCSDTNDYLYLCETYAYDFDTEQRTIFLALESNLELFAKYAC